jgi:rSAM/selenodomain-associated transferase 2
VQISIVIPTLDEAGTIEHLLRDLQPLRCAGHQVLIVDGGSQDLTRERASELGCEVLSAVRGRASQMNAGAARACGDVLWFLHADTRVPEAAAAALLAAIAQGHAWGRFAVRLSGTAAMLRVVEAAMNLRSCWTGLATGDQGIFVLREVFDAVGGYPELPLMEDIALSKRLRRHGRLACVKTQLVTASRRWECKGLYRTILLMWRLRLAYALGADPKDLARKYEAY